MDKGTGRWIVLCLVALCATTTAAETTRYVALVDGGKRAGHQVVTRADDGTVTVDFRFKDNGRGPELRERYTLAPDGTYRDYSVKGTSTFGAPWSEVVFHWTRSPARSRRARSAPRTRTWPTGSSASPIRSKARC